MFSAVSAHSAVGRGNQGSFKRTPVYQHRVTAREEIVSPGRPITRFTRSLSWVPTSWGAV